MNWLPYSLTTVVPIALGQRTADWSPGTLWVGAVSAACGGLGLMTFYLALERGNASLAVPIVGFDPVLVAVLSVAFLDERLSALRSSASCSRSRALRHVRFADVLDVLVADVVVRSHPGASICQLPAMRPTPPPSYHYGTAGVLRRRMRLLVTSRPVAWLSARLLPGLDRAVFRQTRGRVTLSAWVTGLPVVQLTTIGARSGAPRTARVLGIPDRGGFIVIAANFGQTTHPAWYHNLHAQPLAWLVADGVTGEYRARELTGLERDRGFERAITLNPGWGSFQKRAGPRLIPVIQLTRVDAEDLNARAA